jgi:hypothetical protein
MWIGMAPIGIESPFITLPFVMGASESIMRNDGPPQTLDSITVQVSFWMTGQPGTFSPSGIIQAADEFANVYNFQDVALNALIPGTPTKRIAAFSRETPGQLLIDENGITYGFHQEYRAVFG